MYKKLICAILSLCLFSTGIPAFADSAPVVYVNESFDGYALNEVPASGAAVYASGGIDARAVSRQGLDKALYTKAWGRSATVEVKTKLKESYAVISADILLDGKKTSGELFKIKDASNNALPLLKLENDGAMTLNDGKLIDGIRYGQWARVDIAINFSKKTYTLYVDGKIMAERWPMGTSTVLGINSVSFELMPDANGEQTGLYIDNVRIYSGAQILPDSEFPKAVANTEVMDFEPTTEIELVGDKTIKYINFDVQMGYNTVPKSNVIEIREDGDNKYLHFARVENANDSYIDVPLTDPEIADMTNSMSYVVECDIKLGKSEGTIEMLSVKSDVAKWYTGSVGASGKISFGGSAARDEWTRISLVYDKVAKLRSTYIDGTLVATSDFSNVYKPALYRIGVMSGGGSVIYGLDNFRIYGGSELKADEAEQSSDVGSYDSFTSAMETPEDALKLLKKTDFAMMVNNGAYIANSEKSYSDIMPYIKSDRIMMPIRLVSESLGYDVEWNEASREIVVDGNIVFTVDSPFVTTPNGEIKTDLAPEITGSSAFLPLRALCEEILGKNVYWDDRGFVVVSNDKFTYTNSEAVENLKEPIDTLYRYLQFERPSGSQIIADIKEHSPNNTHPRILGTAEDMERMKANVQKDKLMAKWADEVIAEADKHVLSNPLAYSLNNASPPTMLSQSRSMFKRMRDLGVAYVLTGDEKYFESAWKNIEHICNTYPNWNDYQHFLDTGEMSYAFAIGYDMFYDLLSEEQRKLMRDTVVKNAFERGLVAYSGIHPNGYWINGDDNWTSVCPGGLMSAAVAMCDEEDTAAICELILGQTIQSFEYIMSLFYQDGAWYESVNYLEYTMEYMCAGLGSLINASGKTYGLFDAPGVNNILNYTVAMHGPANGAFNYHDGGSGFCIDPTHLWLAKLLGQYGFYNEYLMLKQELNSKEVADARMLIYYDPDKAAAAQPFPLDNYFRQAEVVVMRQNSSDESLWAAVHAGRNGIDHDHLDLGVFEFDAGGVRWAYELGADSYNIPGYFALNGYNVYRKRPEGHNCIVINPREGYQGQNIKCSTSLERRESDARGAITVFDLSNAYDADASRVLRGYMLSDDRRAFIVRDEIDLLEPDSEIYWFMHTRAEVETDGKSAVLTQDGKKLRLSVATDANDYEISVMQAVPLPTSPVVEGMADDSNKHKIAIKLKASGHVGITVKLIPEIGYTDDIAPADNTPISAWTIPTGEIPVAPKATGITINGAPLEGFAPSKYAYTQKYAPVDGVPVIDAAAENGAQVEVIQPTLNNDESIIYVRSPLGCSMYKIYFEKIAKIVSGEHYTPIEIKAINASSVPQPENGKENIADGNPDTRWSADSLGDWVEVDLGTVTQFDAIKMAFYLGGQRTTKFDISISDNGKDYKKIFTGDTSGNTDREEVYLISGKARYVRFVGYGNSEGSPWTSVNEFIPLSGGSQ